jgi:RNA recognition motif-containing protein
MKFHLLMANIPYNCSEDELQKWVESRGVETQAIRIVRDLVSGASPGFAYVELRNSQVTREVIVALDGEEIRQHKIVVREAPARSRRG